MTKKIQKKEKLFTALDVYSRLGAAMDDVSKSASKILSDENKYCGKDSSGRAKQKVA